MGDNWLNRYENFKVTSQPILGLHELKVADLFIPDSNIWNMHVLDELFEENNKKKILSTTPSPVGFPDKRLWHYSPDGRYSVRSEYHLVVSLVDEDSSVDEAA